MTKDDIKLSRQNVTTIVKGSRMPPYPEMQARPHPKPSPEALTRSPRPHPHPSPKP